MGRILFDARSDVTRAEFTSLMTKFPTGVAVVTAFGVDGAPWGMTCSSLCSVTLSPPTLLVCIRDASPTLAAVLACGAFAVNLLHERARTTAELFASGAADRFDRVRWQGRPQTGGGPHLTEDAHAVAHCRLAETLPVGDHVVVFGAVTDLEQRPGSRPLLYGLRGYAAWPTT